MTNHYHKIKTRLNSNAIILLIKTDYKPESRHLTDLSTRQRCRI